MAELPSFSWSHSRDRTSRSCLRKYYYAYYAAPQGATPGADPVSRLAARLKCLTTLDLELGTAVHDRAREILAAVRARRPRPTLDCLRERTRAALNHAYRQSMDRSAFLRDPQSRKMLLPIYYRRGLGEERITRMKEKMDRCLQNLVDCPLWDELDQLGPGAVLAIDRVIHFTFDGVRVYLAPDAVYQDKRGACTICDWKTGSCYGTREQLGGYALYVREALGVVPPDGIYRGRVFGLATGDEERIYLGPDDLEAAAERIRWSVQDMRDLLEDPSQNTPKARDAFPLTDRRSRCGSCEYFQLCEQEIHAATILSDVGAAPSMPAALAYPAAPRT